MIGGCSWFSITTFFFLVTAVWGTAVDPRAPKIGGFGIGPDGRGGHHGDWDADEKPR